MPSNCQASDPATCSYHGRTLVSDEYRDLLLVAKQINSEHLAMQSIVRTTNMNPDVLLKDIRLKEQIIIARIDSTNDGLAYLDKMIEEYQNNPEVIQRLNERKHLGLLLARKREKLGDEIEAHKIEWFSKIKSTESRLGILKQFIQSKVDSFKLTNEKLSEFEIDTDEVSISAYALSEELEAIQVKLVIENI